MSKTITNLIAPHDLRDGDVFSMPESAFPTCEYICTGRGNVTLDGEAVRVPCKYMDYGLFVDANELVLVKRKEK